jgi:hypothetical protein
MRAGYSANQALAYLREQGAGMRRDTFLRAWGEIANDLATRPATADLPLDQPISQSEMSTWRAGRPGTYGYANRVYVRDRSTGLVTSKTHYVFSPVNIAPQAALDQAIGDYLDVQTAGGPSGVVVAADFIQAYTMLGPNG